MVAGGGTGQRDVNGAGGGAGGFVATSSVVVGAGSYAITIGAGGVGFDGTFCQNNHGGNSSIGSLVTALGGGAVANSGGSGGGGNSNGTDFNPGGAGTPGQGNIGGSAIDPNSGAGGGGGAGAVGQDGSSGGVGGNGGAGLSSDISGVSMNYAGGGGGGGTASSGTGGIGGGGAGSTNGIGQDGVANTGGGGGGNGGNNNCGGSGGSGIVIISYSTPGSSPVTANMLAKFLSNGNPPNLGNSLFFDDGMNVTLTSGDLFLQPGAMLDAATSGLLNFGTAAATTMTFGRTGQNMIINSKVGIGTTSPSANLEVNGNVFAKFISLAAGDLGLDTLTSGLLSIGKTVANAIQIGHSGITTTVLGTLSAANFSVGLTSTQNNCNSSASPAVCGSAPAGSVAMATGGSTLVVNTTAVTANSQIIVIEDASLGSRLGITCNTGTGRHYSIDARSPGSSFTIKSSNNPTGQKACLSYWIIN